MRKRILNLEKKIHASARPKRGIVQMCKNDADIKRATEEFKNLPADIPRIILTEKDCRIEPEKFKEVKG